MLEHLLVEQAKNADPMRGFQLKEEIRDVRSQIAELEAEKREPPAQVPNRIANDLSVAIATEPQNVFCYYSSLLHKSLLSFPNLRVDSAYDFSGLADAIHLASESLNDSIELFKLGKDQFAKEELVQGLGYLVVAMAQCCELSLIHI